MLGTNIIYSPPERHVLAERSCAQHYNGLFERRRRGQCTATRPAVRGCSESTSGCGGWADLAVIIEVQHDAAMVWPVVAVWRLAELPPATHAGRCLRRARCRSARSPALALGPVRTDLSGFFGCCAPAGEWARLRDLA